MTRYSRYSPGAYSIFAIAVIYFLLLGAVLVANASPRLPHVLPASRTRYALTSARKTLLWHGWKARQSVIAKSCNLSVITITGPGRIVRMRPETRYAVSAAPF